MNNQPIRQFLRKDLRSSMSNRSTLSHILLKIGVLILTLSLIATFFGSNSGIIVVGLCLSILGYLFLPISKWYDYIERILVSVAVSLWIIDQFGASSWISHTLWEFTTQLSQPLILVAVIYVFSIRLAKFIAVARR
jgi:uncharacterized membrane protein